MDCEAEKGSEKITSLNQCNYLKDCYLYFWDWKKVNNFINGGIEDTNFRTSFNIEKRKMLVGNDDVYLSAPSLYKSGARILKRVELLIKLC